MTCTMSNSGFSYKKTGLITDYFGLHKKRGGEDNDHCNMGNEDWNERLENINRREYSGTNKFTLNDRLLKGKRAGDYWAGTSMGITNVGIIPSVQQLDEKINLPPLLHIHPTNTLHLLLLHNYWCLYLVINII